MALTMSNHDEKRIESERADKLSLALMISDTGGIDVWDFDFNHRIMHLPPSFMDDELIEYALMMYGIAYKDGEQSGALKKAYEIRKALECSDA